jgi:hypothetical protein
VRLDRAGLSTSVGPGNGVRDAPAMQGRARRGWRRYARGLTCEPPGSNCRPILGPLVLADVSDRLGHPADGLRRYRGSMVEQHEERWWKQKSVASAVWSLAADGDTVGGGGSLVAASLTSPAARRQSAGAACRHESQSPLRQPGKRQELRLWPRSTTGSLRGLTRRTCKTPGRCWQSCHPKPMPRGGMICSLLGSDLEANEGFPALSHQS